MFLPNCLPKIVITSSDFAGAWCAFIFISIFQSTLLMFSTHYKGQTLIMYSIPIIYIMYVCSCFKVTDNNVTNVTFRNHFREPKCWTFTLSCPAIILTNWTFCLRVKTPKCFQLLCIVQCEIVRQKGVSMLYLSSRVFLWDLPAWFVASIGSKWNACVACWQCSMQVLSWPLIPW